MKTTINLTLLLTFLISLSFSCKKYEEGGNNFRARKKLTEKKWKFDYASDNDTLFAIMDRWKTIEFKKNGDFVINGQKWGEHTIYPRQQNLSFETYTDSNNIFADSVAILNTLAFSHSYPSASALALALAHPSPPFGFSFNIQKLTKHELCIYLHSTNHKVYYHAD